MIVGHWRHGCLFLIQLGQRQLQLLDQNSLLEPGRTEDSQGGVGGAGRTQVEHLSPRGLFDGVLDEVPLHIRLTFDPLQETQDGLIV